MQKEHDKVIVQSEEFQTELKKTRRFAEKIRDRMGFLQNPDPTENERIYTGLTNNKITKGKRYCPCFVVEGDTKEECKEANNRICPCKPALQNEIPETGKCYCGIFCTAEYIDNILTRVTLPASIFLALIAVFPTFLNSFFGVDFALASFYGGTSLLIIVGVALDTLQQVESHLLMRHYDGFLKSGKIKGRSKSRY